MWQPGWEGSLVENGYRYVYGWVTLLCTWNYYNIVNWLYANIKLKVKKKIQRLTICTDSKFLYLASRPSITWPSCLSSSTGSCPHWPPVGAARPSVGLCAWATPRLIPVRSGPSLFPRPEYACAKHAGPSLLYPFQSAAALSTFQHVWAFL